MKSKNNTHVDKYIEDTIACIFFCLDRFEPDNTFRGKKINLNNEQNQNLHYKGKFLFHNCSEDPTEKNRHAFQKLQKEIMRLIQNVKREQIFNELGNNLLVNKYIKN